MKNKNFLSKFDELKPKVPVHLDIERKLLPRLKIMGYIMYALCLATLAFAIMLPKSPETSLDFQENFSSVAAAGLSLENDDDLLELNPTEVLNFYAVSVIFALVGAICFYTAWKKRKKLFHETPADSE